MEARCAFGLCLQMAHTTVAAGLLLLDEWLPIAQWLEVVGYGI